MRLRPLTAADLVLRVAWMNDCRIYKSMHYDTPVKLDNTEKWFQKISSAPDRTDVVFEDESGLITAMGGLTKIEDNRAELYIFVNPDLIGHGIGSRATYLLCKYGFEILQLQCIYLYTNDSNIAAQKIYAKCGFRLMELNRDSGLSDKHRLYFEYSSSDYFAKLSNNLIIEDATIDNVNIKIVRDDLFPSPGGGNKARKAAFYADFMERNGYNACVTTGGIQSNHNRAIALMCAKNGWRCHIVYHGTRERFEAERGNALLVRKSGATYEFVEAEQIGPAMDSAMARLADDGYKPYYIHGGGHDFPGGEAYVDAVRQLKAQCDRINYKPDYIFHASGTGSTQAGIAVGLDLAGWSGVKLIGVSVARQKERGTQVIEEFANMLGRHYGIGKNYHGKIDFNTDYLCGGYEKYTPEIAGFLDEVMENTGLMFDTTYSGKALYGMCDYIKKNNIRANVLFWHTGGLMNMMK